MSPEKHIVTLPTVQAMPGQKGVQGTVQDRDLVPSRCRKTRRMQLLQLAMMMRLRGLKRRHMDEAMQRRLTRRWAVSSEPERQAASPQL